MYILEQAVCVASKAYVGAVSNVPHDRRTNFQNPGNEPLILLLCAEGSLCPRKTLGKHSHYAWKGIAQSGVGKGNHSQLTSFIFDVNIEGV
ncbi:hypothetical protein M404DRAFT_1007613 [Pisolithus tinctorius Marx 270]|uniref:Uncharacterized protein n=1 Tax=Pisolithus tinctorius Marx 270 TaxID=870435 RepID=A0A0C3IE42_PISTI|nr:hypothetical protein M404DRAFT_1007613 [Pisolithus tinctorius Marx 270]